jgi:hypothetical protein
VVRLNKNSADYLVNILVDVARELLDTAPREGDHGGPAGTSLGAGGLMGALARSRRRCLVLGAAEAPKSTWLSLITEIPIVFSGNDVGFRIERTQDGISVGKVVVRVNGLWVDTATPTPTTGR